MRNFAIIILILGLVFFVSTERIKAQYNAIISGNVYGSNNVPLIGANVLLLEGKTGTVTDINGYFELVVMRPGKYDLQISMIGHEKVIIRQTPASTNPVPLSIVLKEKPIQLEQVEIVRDALRRPQDDTRVSVQTLIPREAKILPGAAEDVLRSLQAFPGVLSPNDFSSQLVIRGSGPDQNLIVMDEIEVFNPYRLYGAVSMFNPETVSDISLISGGFPAKYGDRLSAVLDITNRDGRRQKPFYANINTSLTNANIVLEGQSPLGIRGSWLLSTRRTYYDLIVGPIAKSAGLVDGDVAFPNFRDVQAKLSFGPYNGHRIVVNGVFSRDGVDLVTGKNREYPDSVSVYNTLYNNVAGVGWYYTPDDRILNKFVVSFYNNHGSADFDGRLLDPVLNREDFTSEQNDSLKALARLFGMTLSSSFKVMKYSIKDEISYSFGDHQIEAGAGLDYIETDLFFDLDISEELKQIVQSNPRGSAITEGTVQHQYYSKLNAFVQDRIQLLDRLYFHQGLRLDYYNLLQKIYFSPRLNISYGIDPLTTIRGAVGLYYQSPGYEKLFDQNQFFDFQERYVSSLEAEHTTQYVLGFERWIDSEWRAKVEGYYKGFHNLIQQQKYPGTVWIVSPIAGMDQRKPTGWSEPFLALSDSLTNVPINSGNGEAYGFEVMIEKRNSEGDNLISGWISYSLAWAQRYCDGVLIPFNFDQRHTLNIVGNMKLATWLDLGVFWRFGSNFPTTEPIGVRPRVVEDQGVPKIATDFYGNVILDIDYGDENRVNQARKPLYHRLDIRLTAYAKFWNLDWAFYLDVINVYNHKNVAGYRYYITNTGELGRRTITMFPILPSLGINIRF